ncbi:MAG: ORF6N domain-containing protein [Oscillospiraceae bacterium]|jgi:phage regulator Rha-like protein|nr:ORF6N domain-containing protein [Oscillospiraceae bacterium]
MSNIIKFSEVESKILKIRDIQVILDRDVATLYGVETREINQATKNNADKFPDGYLLTLNVDEKIELIKNFDQFNTIKHTKAMPTAFTEKGLYMLATILKSPQATQTTIAIVEAFAKMREFTKMISQLPDVHDESKQKTLMQRSGEILSEVLDDNSLEISGDETTIEFNFALMKFKHTTKREKRKKE